MTWIKLLMPDGALCTMIRTLLVAGYLFNYV